MTILKAAEETVCEHFDCTPEDIKSERRRAFDIEIRRAFCWLVHKNGGATLAHIGKYLGRNHATVLSHSRRFEELLDVGDPEAVNTRNNLEAIFPNKYLSVRRKVLEARKRQIQQELDRML